MLDYFSPRQLLSVSILSAAEIYILCRSWAGVSLSLLGASASVSADSGVLVPREKLTRGFPEGGAAHFISIAASFSVEIWISPPCHVHFYLMLENSCSWLVWVFFF